MIRAVVFDLDDTLIPEREYVISGFSHVAKIISDQTGLSQQVVFEKLIQLFQLSPEKVFNRLLVELKMPPSEDDIFHLVNVYRNHKPQLQFYEDVIPCIKQLKNKGVKIGIISDGYSSAQQNKIRALNADKYFDYIIITDELGREYWKPHPKAFEIMKEKLNVEFGEMIYIGDNPEKDFYISCILPIKTIRILRDNNIYGNKEYLMGIKPHFNIKSLNELIPILGL